MSAGEDEEHEDSGSEGEESEVSAGESGESNSDAAEESEGEDADGFNSVRELRNSTVNSFTVRPEHLGQGTATNQAARDYVNSPAVHYPPQLRMEAQGGTYTNFPQPPLAPGERAAAGHIRPNSMGGSGTAPENLMPQHSGINSGHYYQGQPTYDLWRRPEDNIRNRAEQGESTHVAVARYHNPAPDFVHINQNMPAEPDYPDDPSEAASNWEPEEDSGDGGSEAQGPEAEEDDDE